MTCEVCQILEFEDKYYDHKYFAILECYKCGIPIVILKAHGRNPHEEEMVAIKYQLQTMWESYAFSPRLHDGVHWHSHILIGG